VANLDRTLADARDPVACVLDRVRPRLIAILARYRIPTQDAEDLTQEAILSLISSWSRVRDPDGWLMGVLRHRCANYWRSRQRRLYELVDDTLLEALAEPQTSPETRLDLAEDLGRAVAKLPPRCQSVFRLRYGLGCTPTETAERLGYRGSSISTVFHRCLSALTRRLVASGFI
jgi:RNA polymerase sigma factor (sigma-70 family)